MEKRIVLSRKQFIDINLKSRVDRRKEETNHHTRFIDRLFRLFCYLILGLILVGIFYSN